MSEYRQFHTPYLWCGNDNNEVNPKDDLPIRVNVGYDNPVEIDKLYGQTGGNLIRVRLDMPKYEWVFEQRRCVGLADSYNHECINEWFEIARADLQPQEDNCS